MLAGATASLLQQHLPSNSAVPRVDLGREEPGVVVTCTAEKPKD